MPPRLFVYRIVTDAGTAPHVGNGYLTLTICKPGIRRVAKAGDYILALVALQHAKLVGKGEERYYKAAYLFKVDETVSMEDYESWCKSHGANTKICSNSHFEGDCQYNAAGTWRPGPHDPSHRERDLGGKFSLVSQKFAAWTSAAPRTLTDSEMMEIGLEKTQVQTATRNFFTVGLERPGQIAALDAIIAEKAETGEGVVVPCKGKKCGMSGSTSGSMSAAEKGGRRYTRRKGGRRA